jgi:4-hydroxy-2-oxoheptanedioate aldolase
VIFADRWRAGEVLDGMLLPLPAPALVEIAGHAAFDFVVLDAEHGPADASLMHAHIATAKALGMGALVRTHPAERAALSRMLDLGADGVFLADVRNPDDAAEAVASALFAPFGDRGFASGSSAAAWGLDDTDEYARRRPLVIAMIEHPAAVSAVAAISSTDGVDGVFVGRMDLAMARLLGPRPAHPRVLEDLEHVRTHATGRIVDLAEDAPPGAVRLHNAARLIGRAFTTAHDEAGASDRSTR